jgi:hypothetical protein
MIAKNHVNIKFLGGWFNLGGKLAKLLIKNRKFFLFYYYKKKDYFYDNYTIFTNLILEFH